ncbi:MAG: hypothetical protein HC837_10190 [Chloroflexaceae bacterium]|nr:hypothetical protein [Chloroflexaceae bacterium]
MNLARQYQSEQEALNTLAQKTLKQGGLRYMDTIEGVNKALNRFIARLQTAPRGYSGWFDAVQIQAHDLEQIYQFDERLAEGIPLLREHIGQAIAEIKGEQFETALEALRSMVDGLNQQFDARDELVVMGKQAASPPWPPAGADRWWEHSQ